MGLNRWPNDIELGLDDRPVVAIFYHPKCPCTRATVRCLQRFSTRFESAPTLIAYAYAPLQSNDDWIESETTANLRLLANTTIVMDREGQIAQRFGAHTSGHVMVFDAEHELLFSGGITPARGHEGEGKAGLSFLDCLNGKRIESSRWPVLGCSLGFSDSK